MGGACILVGRLVPSSQIDAAIQQDEVRSHALEDSEPTFAFCCGRQPTARSAEKRCNSHDLIQPPR